MKKRIFSNIEIVNINELQIGDYVLYSDDMCKVIEKNLDGIILKFIDTDTDTECTEAVNWRRYYRVITYTVQYNTVVD